jgi:hypothetical protein
MTPNEVPKIHITGNVVSSDSTTPRDVADLCACWPKRSIEPVHKLLRARKRIVCLDATARAAVLAMGLEMMSHGISTTGVDDIVLEPEAAR